MFVFSQDYEFSPDGINVKSYKKGDSYDGQGAHAKLFIERLKAKGILAEKAQPKAVDVMKDVIVTLEDKRLKKK